MKTETEEAKMLNEKIKALRKAHNMTQEEMADRICVSRQAITKWETGLGTPDISNLEALARLFDVSIDQLLSEDECINKENISRTEFDIFDRSDFNLDIGTACSLDVTTKDIEKVIVEVRSDLPTESYKLAKVKLTEGRHVDLEVKYVDVKPEKDLSRQDAKQHVFIKLILPSSLADHIELDGNVQKLDLHDMMQEHHIEFDGKASQVSISNLCGHLELTSNTDMEVTYDGSLRQLDINQIRCISNLYIPKDADLFIYNKGRASRVLFNDYENRVEADNKVELNGYKSELTVRTK